MSRRLLFGVLFIAVGAGQLDAGMVYDNGPINGHFGVFYISQDVVSNSFDVTGPATLTSAQVALAVQSLNDPPTTLDWSIGTTVGGSEISSGTAALANSYYPIGFGWAGYAFFLSTFSINGSLSAAGTYYFTLSNATTANGSFVAWDGINGPSAAFVNGVDATNAFDFGVPPFQHPGTSSESFQLFDESVAAVPEPGALTLAALGIVSLAGLTWRKRQRRA